ncbi:MAG TPA: mercuric transporter MerT family protein [Blastocatellia bacterium]|nr:mercuric transporter MerT family protein [Blastocatellia bacterium]
MGVLRTSVASGFSLISAMLSFLPLSCCVFPAAFSVLGASGLAFAAALAPYRPYFIGMTVVSLGVAFYLTYRPSQRQCAPGTACANSKARKFQIAGLWIVTLLTVILMTFPYILPYLPA